MRLLKALVDVTPDQAIFDQKIAAAIFVQQRRARFQRRNRIEYWRQRIIVDLNFRQRALRRAPIFGNDQRHQIAVVTNFINRDKVLVVGNF